MFARSLKFQIDYKEKLNRSQIEFEQNYTRFFNQTPVFLESNGKKSHEIREKVFLNTRNLNLFPTN